MKQIKLFPCGTHIRTTLGQIEGMITAACVRFSSVSYEIAYFYDGEQRTVWMNEAEFSTAGNDKKIWVINSRFDGWYKDHPEEVKKYKNIKARYRDLNEMKKLEDQRKALNYLLR